MTFKPKTEVVLKGGLNVISLCLFIFLVILAAKEISLVAKEICLDAKISGQDFSLELFGFPILVCPNEKNKFRFHYNVCPNGSETCFKPGIDV